MLVVAQKGGEGAQNYAPLPKCYCAVPMPHVMPRVHRSVINSAWYAAVICSLAMVSIPPRGGGGGVTWQRNPNPNPGGDGHMGGEGTSFLAHCAPLL